MGRLRMAVSLGVLCVLALFVTSAYAQETVNLTVNSDYGTPVPSIGVHSYAKPSVVSASVASPVPGDPGVRYACVGWKAKGSKPSNPEGFVPPEIPSVGYTNSVDFTINSNVVLTWKWKAQYLLTLNVSPVAHCLAGHIDYWSEDQPEEPSGTYPPEPCSWWSYKKVAQLHAVAHEGYQFSHWLGGSLAVRNDPTVNPTAQQMRRPENITAVFLPEPRTFTVYSDKGVPVPAVGVYPHYYDDYIVASCGPDDPYYYETECKRWLCTGNLGTGDVEALSRDLTHIEFWLHNDSSVTWVWEALPEYRYDVSSEYGNLAGDGSGWYSEGAEITSYFDPEPPLYPEPELGTFEEGFEAGMEGWTTGGNANWFVTDGWKNSGSYSARSGGITHSQSTYIEREFNIAPDGGSISFWWSSDSENYYDWLRFYIDGGLMASISGPGWGSSGGADTRPPSDWAQLSFDLSGGTHTFKWVYMKDSSYTEYDDCGWIDDIAIEGVYVPAPHYRYLCTGYMGEGDPEVAGWHPDEIEVTFNIDICSSVEFQWVKQWELIANVNPEGSGEVVPPTGYYDEGTLPLEAVRGAAYLFDSWSGDPVYNPDEPDTPETVEILLDAAKTVTANFVKPTLIVANPVGVGECDPEVGTHTYDRSTEVTCTITSGQEGHPDVWIPQLVGGYESVPVMTEGFEAGPPLPDGWTTGSPAWSVSTRSAHSGSYGADGGIPARYYESYVQTQVTVGDYGGTVSFYYRFSRRYSRNYYRFYIDGSRVLNYNSSSTSWRSASFSLGAGTHTLKWAIYTGYYRAPYWGFLDDVQVNTLVLIPGGDDPDATYKYIADGYDATGGVWDQMSASGPGNQSNTLNIQEHSSITWKWFGQYKLTVSANPADKGSVTVSPVEEWYDEGDEVTLEAFPVTGWYFNNWSGDASGSDNPLTITMDGPKNIIANFAITTWTVEIDGTPDNPYPVYPEITGGLAKANTYPYPGYGTHTYDYGTEVTLSCGYTPRDWTGHHTPPIEVYDCIGWVDGSGDIPETSSDLSVTFTVTQNSTITWNWHVSYPMYISVTPTFPVVAGTTTPPIVQIGTDWMTGNPIYGCWVNAAPEATVFEAHPAAGFSFSHWSGDYSSTANPASFVIEGPPFHWYESGGWYIEWGPLKSIVANFTIDNPHTLMIASEHSSPVPPVGPTTCPDGYSIELYSGPTEYVGTTRYLCTGWTGGYGSGTPATGTTNRYTIPAITEDSGLTWTWRPQFQLTTAYEPQVYPWPGSVSGGGWYDPDTIALLTATANAGWGFSHWSGDPVNNPDDPLTPETVVITMNTPHSVTAHFFQPTLMVYNPDEADAPSPAAGGPYTYPYNQAVTCMVTSPTLYEYLPDPYIEGFETDVLPPTGVWWRTGGSANWFRSTLTTHSGTYAAESGDIGDNQETWLEREVTIGAGGGTMSFWWRVRSESGYDWLEFYINGTRMVRDSGNRTWSEQSFPLDEGLHTIKWRYVKDSSVSSYNDCGWVDDLVVTNTSSSDSVYLCTGYTGTGSVPDSGEESSVTFNITEDSSITWHWVAIAYTLTVTINPEGAGTVAFDPPVPDTGYYDHGTYVQMYATGSGGYTFAWWSGDMSGTANPATILMDGAKYVTAHFHGPVFVGVADSSSAITWSWTYGGAADWFMVQDSTHTDLSPAVYAAFWQETGLTENTQYTRHVHAVLGGAYSTPSNDDSRYTLVHNAITDDFYLYPGFTTETKTVGIQAYRQARQPIDISYNYARCQYILYGSEMAVGGPSAAVIEKIRFQRYNGDADTVNNAELHMAHTSAMNVTEWQDTSGHTLVFSGDLSIPDESGWYEIALSPSFSYNGTSNLIISFRHQDGSGEGENSTTWMVNGIPGRYLVMGASDTENPPPAAPNPEPTAQDLPNTQFDMRYGSVAITVIPPVNSTVGLTGVRIERDSSSGFTSPVLVQDYMQEPYDPATKTDAPPYGSATWWYRIRFRNAEGIESNYSPAKSADVP